jgi:SAM-dependent methyltransferase
MKAEETADQYRELFRLRAVGELDEMECAKSLLKLMKELYFEGAYILDIPCGVGHYYRTLRKLGNIWYHGADADKVAIDIAKNTWYYDRALQNVKFFVCDVISGVGLPFRAYDFVICYNLLLHLPHYQTALTNLLHTTNKYLIIRSLFAEETKIMEVEIPEGYDVVYGKRGIYYNVWGEYEIVSYIKQFGNFSCKFIDDEVVVADKEIERQSELLGVSKSTFTSGKGYKVLLVERLI